MIVLKEKRNPNMFQRLRESRGLNQYEFAELVGMKQAQVSRIERYEQRPSMKCLFRIKMAFEIDLNEFIRKMENQFWENERVRKPKEKMQ